MEPRRRRIRNLRRKQVLDPGARHRFSPPPARAWRDGPSGRLRFLAGQDRSRLHGQRPCHRHERRGWRSGQRLLHLSWPGRRRRRRRGASPGGDGRRLPAKTDGGLRFGPPPRRRHDPDRQGVGSGRAAKGCSLLRRHAPAATTADVRRGGPGHLPEWRRLAGRCGLCVLSRRRGTGLWSRRQSRDRRSAGRLHPGTDRPLEVRQASQRPARRHGGRRQTAF